MNKKQAREMEEAFDYGHRNAKQLSISEILEQGRAQGREELRAELAPLVKAAELHCSEYCVADKCPEDVSFGQLSSAILDGKPAPTVVRADELKLLIAEIRDRQYSRPTNNLCLDEDWQKLCALVGEEAGKK